MRFEFNAPIRCGLAFKDGIHSIIASPSLGRMRVERRGANLRVHVSWRKEYRNAEVWFRMKDGELVKRAISRSAALSAKLDVPWANRVAKVQLLAEGRQGPKVLAERWLHVTKDAPLKTDSPDAWLADLRRRAHVPLQVRRNELIDAASKAHARHMCESGHVVHNLGDGDVEERLKRYGLIARKVGEVISRAPTLNDALQGLAESPSHHATLIDKDLTDWGIGVLRGKDGVYCVAIIVAAWPRTIAN